MSYTVALATSPVPENDADAWKAIDELIELEGEAPTVFRKAHDLLTAKFPCLCDLSDDDVDDGVWSDGPLWNNFGSRAAVLGISFSRVEEVLPHIQHVAVELGLVLFDWQTEQIHRSAGLPGVVLTLEGGQSQREPTLSQLSAAVDKLNPNGGPGFLVVDGPNDEYAQAAGGRGSFTAEWRENSGSSFKHFVAGRAGVPADREIAVKTNGFEVTVKENEQLDAEDVEAILGAFARRESRPAAYAWRDVTDRFL